MGRRVFLAVFAILFLNQAVGAGMHLVSPGDDWERLIDKVSPGDEIILMPGRHRAARFDGLEGSGKQPIIIRSARPEQPAIIEASGEGILLNGASHLVIKDLTVTGAKINGITITAPSRTGVNSDELWPAYIDIENVTVLHTGGGGNKRHAIQVSGVTNVNIKNCKIHGWGGAGVDVMSASRVDISKCEFRGHEEYPQQAAVHVRGGSDVVRITDCTMVDSGVYSIIMGGEADKPLNIPGVVQTASTKSKTESGHTAARVQVMRCVIKGSLCPIHFLSATDCQVRNVTMIRPKQWVMAIDLAKAELNVKPSVRLTFGSNLIMWEPGDLDRLARLGSSFRDKSITIEQNLWWSKETAEQRASLGQLPVEPIYPQITDVDPEMDKVLRPTARKALLVGAHAP